MAQSLGKKGTDKKKEVNPIQRKSKKIWLKVILMILGVLFLTIAGYVIYVYVSYDRIDDNQPLTVQGTAENTTAKQNTEYTAVSYNIGFGAYTPDFTFFMDGGTQSWAKSEESVISCIDNDVALLQKQNADIIFLQEVDFNSTRSYHVDEAAQILSAFGNSSSTFAVNYHSAFLFYPLLQPHGSSNAGMLTISNLQITSALRRSLPIAESLSKFIDLDRCYAVSRTTAENGKELVLINAHLSAYGTDGNLQQQQTDKLFNDMREEYDKGNYVICAGDFNHDFLKNSTQIFNKEVPEEYSWAKPFPDEQIPEHFRKVDDYPNAKTVPSCRNCDKPYGKDCFTLTVDGFIVSDNVNVTYANVIDTQFAYSDHNPVIMKFKLS